MTLVQKYNVHDLLINFGISVKGYCLADSTGGYRYISAKVILAKTLISDYNRVPFNVCFIIFDQAPKVHSLAISEFPVQLTGN